MPAPPYDAAAAGYADILPMKLRPVDIATWTFPSHPFTPLANGTVLLTDRIYACKVPVWDGLNTSGITWLSSSQVMSGVTSQLSSVHDESGAVLKAATDRGATAWPVSTWGDFPFPSDYRFDYTGFAYLSIKITASTQVPSLSCVSFSATLAGNQRGPAPTPDNRVYCGTAQTVAGAIPALTLPLAAVGSLPVAGLIRSTTP